MSTFIPLKIRKRGASKVVVHPDGQVEAPGVATQFDQPLLVALTRAFYWQQLLDDGVVGSGSEIAQREVRLIIRLSIKINPRQKISNFFYFFIITFFTFLFANIKSQHIHI